MAVPTGLEPCDTIAARQIPNILGFRSSPPYALFWSHSSTVATVVTLSHNIQSHNIQVPARLCSDSRNLPCQLHSHFIFADACRF